MHVISVDWRRARESLDGAAHRVAGLLRSVPDPQARGPGVWTASETAAHLSQTLAVDLASARGVDLDLPPPMASPVSALRGVSDFNADNLGSDAERDLGALATRIEETASDFLAETAGAGGDEPASWLGGVKLPVSALACHWIGESLLHGLDIARGNGLRWVIEPEWAGLSFAGFSVPVIESFDPRSLVDQEKAGGLTARVDVRVRGFGRAVFVLESGALRVESAGRGTVDCHLVVDPATNFLMAWGRISPLRAAAKGRLILWGRRPLRALKLTQVIRTP